MKKLFTLLSVLAMFYSLNAQLSQMRYIGHQNPSFNQMPIGPVASPNLYVAPKASAGALRSTGPDSTTIILDYAEDDGIAAGAVGGTEPSGYVWPINANYTNADEFTLKFAAQFYDTLIAVLDQSGDEKTFPLASSAIIIDSIEIPALLDDSALVTDTLTITVFNTDSLGVTNNGLGPNAQLINNVLWDTSFIITDNLPYNFTFGAAGAAPNGNLFAVYPNLSLPQGTRFGIRVDFTGSTAASFEMASDYIDLCAGSCEAATPLIGFNSLYYINFIDTYQTTPTIESQNLSGICGGPGSPFYYGGCDTSVSGYAASACENIENQDWLIWPFITIINPFSVSIAADSFVSCQSNANNLAANVLGSVYEPFTYNWSVKSGDGQLSSTSDSTVVFTPGLLTSVVSVTVTDANFDSTTTSIGIVSRAMTAGFASLSYTVPCTNPGAGTALVPKITGNGASLTKTYLWNTGSVSSEIGAKTPGVYSYTVVNSEGCTASASVEVTYPDGINNNVSISGPTTGVPDQQLNFTNTSSDLSGWTESWSMGNDSTITSVNASIAYAQSGVYVVVLTMDSAGCTFTSAPLTVNITPAGINDVSFDNTISLQPNPTNGSVLLTVNSPVKGLTISAYNILGEEIKSFQVSDISGVFSRTLDFSQFAGGTYLIKVQSGDKVAIKKLVVAR